MYLFSAISLETAHYFSFNIEISGQALKSKNKLWHLNCKVEEVWHPYDMMASYMGTAYEDWWRINCN